MRQVSHVLIPVSLPLLPLWGKDKAGVPLVPALGVSFKDIQVEVSLSLLPRLSSSKVILDGKGILKADSDKILGLIQKLVSYRTSTPVDVLVTGTSIGFPDGFAIDPIPALAAGAMKAVADLFGGEDAKDVETVLTVFPEAYGCLANGFLGLSLAGKDLGWEAIPSHPDLAISGLGIRISDEPKAVSPQEAMKRAVETSPYYPSYQDKSKSDYPLLVKAIQDGDFDLIGKTAMENGIAMHQTIVTVSKAFSYFTEDTLKTMWALDQLRIGGLDVWYVLEPGPNLIALVKPENLDDLKARLSGQFPGLTLVDLPLWKGDCHA